MPLLLTAFCHCLKASLAFSNNVTNICDVNPIIGQLQLISPHLCH